MTEEAGCALLKSRFAAAGYTILEEYLFSEEGVSIKLDGFDPDQCVGYEYITSIAGDRKAVTPEIVEALEARMARGKLFVLLVDEVEAPTEQTLTLAADRFLARLRERL